MDLCGGMDAGIEERREEKKKRLKRLRRLRERQQL